MDISSVLTLLYLIIGLIVVYVYTKPNKDIDDKNNESGMVCIYLLMLLFIWPYCLYKLIFNK